MEIKLLTSNQFKINNFDIIRLIAALQVAIEHTITHLNLKTSLSPVFSILSYIPGVPIFFFISGFLISKSYENNTNIKDYIVNRALRIYPALIFCVAISVIAVYLTGYLGEKEFSFSHFILWIGTQTTFLQFYNPEFMRDFGVGVINGSLWTIAVELQFYIMIPILYYIFGFSKSNNHHNRNLLFLISIFLIFFMIECTFDNIYKDYILFKIFEVTFIPWIWMFLVGVFFQKNFDIIYKFLSGKLIYILPSYIIIAYYTRHYLGWHIGNDINPILYILLTILIFSMAYSYSTFSQKILKRNDISYGIYIYHMPIVNIFIYYGYTQEILSVVTIIFLTISIALASWFLIEKPAIRLKKHTLIESKEKKLFGFELKFNNHLY